jgi:hypothetical protein
MNGFITFDRDDAVEDFLSAPEIQRHISPEHFVRQLHDSLIIFRGLSSTEVDIAQEVADRLGGRIKPSTQYYPM